jgi:hypothetical protein
MGCDFEEKKRDTVGKYQLFLEDFSKFLFSI